MARIEANILIDTGHTREIDWMMFASQQQISSNAKPEVQILPLGTKLEDLMVEFGIFASKGQARKAGRGGEIPWGWSEIQVGKVHHELWIWKPMSDEQIEEILLKQGATLHGD